MTIIMIRCLIRQGRFPRGHQGHGVRRHRPRQVPRTEGVGPGRADGRAPRCRVDSRLRRPDFAGRDGRGGAGRPAAHGTRLSRFEVPLRAGHSPGPTDDRRFRRPSFAGGSAVGQVKLPARLGPGGGAGPRGRRAGGRPHRRRVLEMTLVSDRGGAGRTRGSAGLLRRPAFHSMRGPAARANRRVALVRETAFVNVARGQR